MRTHEANYAVSSNICQHAGDVAALKGVGRARRLHSAQEPRHPEEVPMPLMPVQHIGKYPSYVRHVEYTTLLRELLP